MRCLWLFPVIPLVACDEGTGDKVGGLDTSDVVCERVHGATGIALYGYDDGGTADDSADDAWNVNFPDTAPDGLTRTTGLTGPLSDGETLIALFGGRLLSSTDGGCYWDDDGGVLSSAGDWSLDVKTDTIYAFDRASSSGAFSKDAGNSWTPTDASEPFVGLPVWDSTGVGKLRGVQARGVLTTEDEGKSWDVSGTVPEGTLTAAAVYAGDLNTIVAATTAGVFVSKTGGESWTDIGTNVIEAGISPTRVAIHPTNPDMIWVTGTDTDGVTIEATTDGGTNWKPIAATQNVDLDPNAELWPDPTKTNVVLSHYDSPDGSVTMYRLFGGNIESHKVSAYTGLSDIAFLPDGSWMAGIDSVP